jgi:hypothetical protein
MRPSVGPSFWSNQQIGEHGRESIMAGQHNLSEALNDLSGEQRKIVEEFIGYLKWRDQVEDRHSWYWADEWRRRFREAQLAEYLA